MSNLKIKKVKKLAQAKEIFSFISSTNYVDSFSHNKYYLPLHSLYNNMIDNIYSENSLLLYAKMQKETIGASISFPLNYDSDTLYLQIFTIKEAFRHNGFAKLLLDETFKKTVTMKLKRLRIDFNQYCSDFFFDRDFKLYLEITMPLNVENIFPYITKMNLNLVKLYSFENQILAKYEVDNYSIKTINELKGLSPLLSTKYILEKEI